MLGDLRPATSRTITDPARLRRQLETVRRRRFARTIDEMTLGTTSIAVPLQDQTGDVVAALGAVLDARRGDQERLVPALHIAAHGIGRLLRPRRSRDHDLEEAGHRPFDPAAPGRWALAPSGRH